MRWRRTPTLPITLRITLLIMWARQSASGCGLAVGVIVTAGADVITAVDTDTAVFTAVDTDVVVFTAVDPDAVVFTAVGVGGTVEVSGGAANAILID
jgi:hypothetical protein